jgi:hypothetical protein
MNRPGHRTYIDNPKLVSTRPVKPPIAYGHRRMIDASPSDRNPNDQ